MKDADIKRLMKGMTMEDADITRLMKGMTMEDADIKRLMKGMTMENADIDFENNNSRNSKFYFHLAQDIQGKDELGINICLLILITYQRKKY